MTAGVCAYCDVPIQPNEQGILYKWFPDKQKHLQVHAKHLTYSTGEQADVTTEHGEDDAGTTEAIS